MSCLVFSQRGRGGNISGHLFHRIPLYIIVESSNDYLNVLVTDEQRSFILRGTVNTRIQANRELVS